MLSAKPICSMTGLFTVESAALQSISRGTTSLEAPLLLRPPKSFHNVDVTTSAGGTNNRGSKPRAPPQVPAFSINESTVPTTMPPIHLKPPPRHKRSVSVPTGRLMADLRPHTAHGMAPATRRSEVEFLLPILNPRPLNRPKTSNGLNGSTRPHTMYNTSDSFPSKSSSSKRTPVSRDSPESPSSPISLAFKTAGTWTPPDSWSGPPTPSENPGNNLKKSNSKLKLKIGNQSFSRLNILSPSFWKNSFLIRGTQGGGSRICCSNEVPPDQHVLVTVEGQAGMTQKAAINDIIPQLRALKSIPH